MIPSYAYVPTDPVRKPTIWYSSKYHPTGSLKFKEFWEKLPSLWPSLLTEWTWSQRPLSSGQGETPSQVQYKYYSLKASIQPCPTGPGLKWPSSCLLEPSHLPTLKGCVLPYSTHSQNLSLKLCLSQRPPRVGDFYRQCRRAARGRGT